MRIYSQADEECIRTQAHVHEWRRSGFLEPAQAAGLQAELRVNLQRTNSFLRALVFLFTAVIVTASVALIAIVFDLHETFPAATIYFLAALITFGAAEFLVRRFRVYRFGIEEALASASVVLLSIAAGETAGTATCGVR